MLNSNVAPAQRGPIMIVRLLTLGKSGNCASLLVNRVQIRPASLAEAAAHEGRL